MHIIDYTILAALKRLRTEFDTQSDFAAHLGVSSTMAAKWLSKKSQNFSDRTWKRIEPLLQPYIRPVCWYYLTKDECIFNQNSSLKKLLDNFQNIPEGIPLSTWVALINTSIDREREKILNKK